MDSVSDIIKENKIFRFASELNSTTDETRKMAIKAIIQRNTTQKTPMEEFNLNLEKIDKLQYKKLFYKLKPFQKEDRIKRYTEKMFKDNTCSIANQIVELLDTGKLKTKDIDYDIDTCEIVTINTIDIKDGSVIKKMPVRATKTKTVKVAKTKTSKKALPKLDTSSDDTTGESDNETDGVSDSDASEQLSVKKAIKKSKSVKTVKSKQEQIEKKSGKKGK